MRPATETHLRPARSLPAILEHAKTRSTAGAGVVVALIPAHNEEDQIEQAIRSLHEQSSTPDVLVVVADNCTDGTARVAEAAGAYVFESVGNRHKKAGALNQVLGLLL